MLDLSLDGRRKASVKRIQEELEIHKTAFRQLLGLVCEPGCQRLQTVSPLLQRSLSFEEVAAHLQAAIARPEETPRPPTHSIKRETTSPSSHHSQGMHEQSHSEQSPISLHSSDAVDTQNYHADFVWRLRTVPEAEAFHLLQHLREPSTSGEWILDTGPNRPQRPRLNISLTDSVTRGHFSAPSSTQHKESPPLSAGSRLAAIHLGNESENSFDSNPTNSSGQTTPGGPSLVNCSRPVSAQAEQVGPDGRAVYLELGHLAQCAQKLPALFGTFAERLDDHIACSAVFQGWADLKQSVRLDPQWQVLERWDSEVVRLLSRYDSQLSVVDRLSQLHLLRRVSKWLAAPDRSSEEVQRSIPGFFQPIPSQHSLDAFDIVHYTPWPGVREVMIRDPLRFQTDRFWTFYLRSWHLLWPFDPVAICCNAKVTDMLSSSEQFNQRFFDINCWTLDKAFLDAYPELRFFARQYESSPSILIQQPKPLTSPRGSTRDRDKHSKRQRSPKGKKRGARDSWLRR